MCNDLEAKLLGQKVWRLYQIFCNLFPSPFSSPCPEDCLCVKDVQWPHKFFKSKHIYSIQFIYWQYRRKYFSENPFPDLLISPLTKFCSTSLPIVCRNVKGCAITLNCDSVANFKAIDFHEQLFFFSSHFHLFKFIPIKFTNLELMKICWCF